MTDPTIALAGMAKLAEKGPDVEILRQMVVGDNYLGRALAHRNCYRC